MNLPEKIKVLSADYTIKTVGADWVKETESRGQCDCNNHIITIPDVGKPCQQLDTMTHELLHAVCDLMQLTDDDKEEDYVSRMATGLIAVLRDNPEYRKWMWQTLKKLD